MSSLTFRRNLQPQNDRSLIPAPTRPLAQGEFIALVAMTAATVAFSIDAMLPALPEIAAELSPDAPNVAQLIVTSFVFGMGLGTFFTGPLSDAFGRKTVVIGGNIIFVLAAAAAWQAQSLTFLLIARFMQGIGASGPRVVAMAIVRDLYSGPEMARILSYVMMIFVLVPALAPTLGAGIIAIAGWRFIFLAFVLFSVLVTLWLVVRQPETLPPENRRPLSASALWSALCEMLAHPTARLSIFAQTLVMGMMFSVLSTTQQVFDVTFNEGDRFHFWFGAIAIVAASASIVNARLVVRLGMRALIRAMFIAQICFSSLMVVVSLLNPSQDVLFWTYLLWTTSVFFQAGMAIGNLNALAMEPMGHIAGLAASVLSSVATVGAVILAVPVGLAFNGTPLPIAIAFLPMATLALIVTTKIKRPGEA